MVYIRRGNLYGERTYPYRDRHHKHMGFRPHPQLYHKSKSELQKYLMSKKVSISGKMVPIAHVYHYRLYHHKYRGWTLYIGPQKISHGGLRTKPSQVRYITKYYTQRGMSKARAQAIAKYWTQMKKMRKRKILGPISAKELKELENLEKQYKLGDMPPTRAPGWEKRKSSKGLDFSETELDASKLSTEERRTKAIENIHRGEKDFDINQGKVLTKAEREKELGIQKGGSNYKTGVSPYSQDITEKIEKHYGVKWTSMTPSELKQAKRIIDQKEGKTIRKDEDRFPRAFEGLPNGTFRDVDSGKILSYDQVKNVQLKLGKAKVKIDYATNLPAPDNAYWRRPKFVTEKSQKQAKEFLAPGVKPFKPFKPEHHIQFTTIDKRKIR